MDARSQNENKIDPIYRLSNFIDSFQDVFFFPQEIAILNKNILLQLDTLTIHQ